MRITEFNAAGNIDINKDDLVKGIAFLKSRRAVFNLAQMLIDMNLKTIPNGGFVDTAYVDASISSEYDRKEIGWFFEVLKEKDYKVVVVRSLNDITDDMRDLEEFIRIITDMGLWLYSLEVGPVPIIASHAEDF